MNDNRSLYMRYKQTYGHGLVSMLLVAIALLLSLKLNAQGYKILTYNSKAGLNNSLTKAISQDSLGFIWIATDDGIERFDGTNFQAYTDNLPSNFTKSFLHTNNGNMFAVTDMGVVQINIKRQICSSS